MNEELRIEGQFPFEETLDPENWDAIHALGHQMLEDAFSYLETVRERPVWQPVPEQVKQHLQQPLPQKPQDIEAVYHDFCRKHFTLPDGQYSPSFLGVGHGHGGSHWGAG